MRRGAACYMRRLTTLYGTTLILVAAAVAAQGPKADEARGELIYSTYCVGCHTTQVHWREKRLATDWTSLLAQCRRWQRNSGLSLGEDDIAAIARHLNALYYRYPMTDNKQSGKAEPTPQLEARAQG